ncbi:hypothetical protein [Sphingomonas sp. Leaf62]|uniref:hypothetical protein n=1 Tax=Sphingomonas sp. Leaf62 TaxID=1736228 RepID=UPI0006FFD8B2|nr:hypothetical protein [Sphingomonas sp. Leaf62]KQN78555.1 hypothetical protein ASE91_14150 [Sphingomonas sp. Leaf62]
MPHSSPLLDELERLTDEMDLLLACGRASIPSHRLVEELADEARRIARRLDEAARGGCRPLSNPPRYVSPDGTKAGW